MAGMAGMFQHSLRDMIGGIRAHAEAEAAYVQNAVVPAVRKEAKAPDPRMKALAVQKAAYLQMMGYPAPWAAFPAVEAMSSAKLAYKAAGYQAAGAIFGPDTDVMLLVPNLLKKELASKSALEVCLALDCLANLMTLDLARDLIADVFGLLNSSKSIIRRRAALCLYKGFQQYPDALRPCFKGLTERLDDAEPSVVAAAISVLCELTVQHPHNYLQLVPIFYKLLQGSTSNWTTIKLLKIFTALVPLEPRLGKKLAAPVAEFFRTAGAKSIVYECVQLVVAGMHTHEPVLRLAVEAIQDFVAAPDANLKYLGLCAVENLVGAVPAQALTFRETILACLEAADTTVINKCLKLLADMVDEANLPATVATMTATIPRVDADTGDRIIALVIQICSRDRYALLQDFPWYVRTLVDLAHTPRTGHGALIAAQLADVAVRVDGLRPSLVGEVRVLLADPSHLNPRDASTVHHVLHVAAWATGEYAAHVGDRVAAAEALLQPSVANLPAETQVVYVQALAKLLVAATGEGAEADRLAGVVGGHLGFLLGSPHREVQQQAYELDVLVRTWAGRAAGGEGAAEAEAAFAELRAVFGAALGPVSARAQRKVPRPEGLDLAVPELRDDPAAAEAGAPGGGGSPALSRDSSHSHLPDAASALTAVSDAQSKESAERARAELRDHREQNQQFYLGGEARPQGEAGAAGPGRDRGDSIDQIRVVDAPLTPAPGGAGAPAGRLAVNTADDELDASFELSPPGSRRGTLDIDVMAPLDAAEALPAAPSYPAARPRAAAVEAGGVGGAGAAAAAGAGEERRRKKKSSKRRENETAEERAERKARRAERKAKRGAGGGEGVL